MPLADPSSESNFEDFHCTNISLKWTIDLEKNIITGHAILKFDVVNKRADILKLDISSIEINSIVNANSKEAFKWTIGNGKLDPKLGQLLTIHVPAGLENFSLDIDYRTHPSATALQWLSAEQTLGRKHPFMFSQCEEIHARSIVPCQDTPMIKSTYDAKVTVPPNITVLMSAVYAGDTVTHSDGCRTFQFLQRVPIPSYLIAIACGDLVGREIGPRSYVWSEPAAVDAARFEFQDTENMIQIAEKLCGIPYLWQRYDLLVLPPTFPFGGMENPCLTFITPTLVVGDRSLTSVIAHEISHSWTGNLVTNANWEHFWLNEGHTVYLERLIVGAFEEKLTGSAEKGKALRHLHMQLGYDNLKEITGELCENFTKLIPDLKDIDPDEYFSRVPYEKGSLFLFYLEGLVGLEVMLTWLKAYLSTYSYKALDSYEWQSFLIRNFQDQEVPPSIVDSIDFDTWLNGAGLPPFTPTFDTSLSEACESLYSKWQAFSPEEALDSYIADYTAMNTKQQIFFWQLVRLGAEKLSEPAVMAMKEAYKLEEIKNCEILFEWALLAIDKKLTSELPMIFNFVTIQGRMKYLGPVYSALGKWTEVRDETIKTFQEQRPFMHTTSAKKVEHALGLREADCGIF